MKNFEKEDLYSYDFLQTPNENGNNSMKLPTGDGYISVYHEKDVSIEKEKYFLEEYAGEALGESNNSIKIDFPMDPIVNPENIEEELWFGRLLKNGTAYMITRAMIRILLFYVLEMKL